MIHDDILRLLGFRRSQLAETQRAAALRHVERLVTLQPLPLERTIDALERAAPFPGEGVPPDGSLTMDDWATVRRVVAAARAYSDAVEDARRRLKK